MCGKPETYHWRRHWDKQHGIEKTQKSGRFELVGDEKPTEKPWCSNWEEIRDAARK